MLFIRFSLAGALLALLAACAGQPPQSAPSAAEEPVAPSKELFAEDKPSRRFDDDSFYQLLAAEFAIRRQQYDLALDLYLNQAHHTRDLGVVSTAARLAQYVNNHQAAIEAVQLWLELAPDDRDAHYLAASSLAKSRQPLKALPHMIAVLEDGAESNFAALAASVLTLPEQDQLQFLAELNRLLESHPDDTSLKTAKALMLQYRNQEAQALQLIREVLAKSPEDIHALLIETRLLQQLEREEEALERLRFAVDAHPGHKRLRLQYARLLTKSDLHLAKAQFTVLVQQFPDDGSLLLGLALINQEIGDYEQAKEQFEALLQIASHNAQAHYFLGRLAEREQDWSEAINHYLKVTPGEEFLPSIKRLVAIANEVYGLSAARQQVQSLRAMHPQQEVQLTLIESDLLFEAHQYEAGHELLTRALVKHPQQSSLLYARSLFSERRNNIALLEQDLRAILDSEPGNATALNALGYSLAVLTDRLEEARDLVKKALDIRPDDPAIQDSYGWIAYRLGDLQLAHNYLQRAFKQSQDHEIAAHLGEVLWRLGEYDQARQVWRTGLENKPESTIIRDTLQRLQADIQ